MARSQSVEQGGLNRRSGVAVRIQIGDRVVDRGNDCVKLVFDGSSQVVDHWQRAERAGVNRIDTCVQLVAQGGEAGLEVARYVGIVSDRQQSPILERLHVNHTPREIRNRAPFKLPLTRSPGARLLRAGSWWRRRRRKWLSMVAISRVREVQNQTFRRPFFALSGETFMWAAPNVQGTR